MDDLLKEVQDSRWCALSVGKLLACCERELANGKLHNAEAKAPDIRLDCVLLALDSLRCHVCGGTDEGVGNGIDQLARNAKITELDGTSRVDEDVGGLDISVHDVMGRIEICQSSEGGFSNLSENVHPYWAEYPGNAVKRPGKSAC